MTIEQTVMRARCAACGEILRSMQSAEIERHDMCRTYHGGGTVDLLQLWTHDEIIVLIGRETIPVTNPNWAKTHCPRGHEYNEDNTYRYRDRRYCKKCQQYRKIAEWSKTNRARLTEESEPPRPASPAGPKAGEVVHIRMDDNHGGRSGLK